MNILFKPNSSFILLILLLSSVATSLYAQTASIADLTNTIKVTNIIDFVTLNRSSEDGRPLTEGESLLIGDLIRTGNDSAIRIEFPDGTVQTLCGNTSYEVIESGTEEGDASNADVIASFSRCDIKPRFIGRCFNRGDAFLSDFSKAGQGNKVGGSGSDSNNRNTQSNVLAFNSQERDSGFSDRCTRSERLFLTVNNITIPEVINVPEPAPQSTVLAESGGSPVK